MVRVSIERQYLAKAYADANATRAEAATVLWELALCCYLLNAVPQICAIGGTK